MQILPCNIETGNKMSADLNGIRIYLDASISTFPLMIGRFFFKGRHFTAVLTALARARFSVTRPPISFPENTPHGVSAPSISLLLPSLGRVALLFFFLALARASRRYRDLRPVKRGNEQDVDNDDTLTRSAHRFLLLATRINSGRACAHYLI